MNKTLKTNYAEFSFISWDGKTNPFNGEQAARHSDSLALNEQFAEAFAQGFLQTTANKDEVFTGSGPDLDPSAWNSRISLLRKRLDSGSGQWNLQKFGSFDFLKLIESADLSSTLFADFDKECRVTCWVHQDFSRPFTALGPNFHLFVDRLHHLDILDAARMVHELAHVRDASQWGWRIFQRSGFESIERPALLAEKHFLLRRLNELDPNQQWESSTLRYLWNQAMATENADLRYLNLLEELDPVAS